MFTLSQVRETRQNTASSRSHQIVRIVVESRPNTHAPSAPAFVSTMHFVDLCGSERLSQVRVVHGLKVAA